MKSLQNYICQGKNIPIREYIEEKLVVNKDYETNPILDFTKVDKLYRIVITRYNSSSLGIVFTDVMENVNIIDTELNDEYSVTGYVKLINFEMRIWTYHYNEENNILYNTFNNGLQFDILIHPNNIDNFIDLVKEFENGTKGDTHKQYSFVSILNTLNINRDYLPKDDIRDFVVGNMYTSYLSAGSDKMKKLKKLLNI